MKRILALALVLFVWSANAQQFPVGAFKTLSVLPGETPLTFRQQLAKTLPLMESAYLTYAVPFVVTSYNPPEH